MAVRVGAVAIVVMAALAAPVSDAAGPGGLRPGSGPRLERRLGHGTATVQQKNRVCFSPLCYQFTPTTHCDLCCMGTGPGCTGRGFSCGDCDCTGDTICGANEHCTAPKNYDPSGVTSWPLPDNVRGHCCNVSRTGDSCQYCSVGFFADAGDCKPCDGLVNNSVPCNGHGTCDGSGKSTGTYTGNCTCDRRYYGKGCEHCNLKYWDCPTTSYGICSNHVR